MIALECSEHISKKKTNNFVTVYTQDDLLRENLAAAIASCASYGKNTQELGRLKTVAAIVSYMVSKNPRVHRTTAMALQKLSVDPQNCIVMHQVCINFLAPTKDSNHAYVF